MKYCKPERQNANFTPVRKKSPKKGDLAKKNRNGFNKKKKYYQQKSISTIFNNQMIDIRTYR